MLCVVKNIGVGGEKRLSKRVDLWGVINTPGEFGLYNFQWYSEHFKSSGQK